MEILFIWLFDYKNFKEQGFNFSSEFIFNVEKEGKKSYQLNISKNKNFIPNFFEKSNMGKMVQVNQTFLTLSKTLSPKVTLQSKPKQLFLTD